MFRFKASKKSDALEDRIIAMALFSADNPAQADLIKRRLYWVTWQKS